MFLMRSVFFYPLLAVIGCALTWWSLQPAITPRTTGAVAAKESPAGFVFDLAALGSIQPDPTQPSFVQRARNGKTEAVRLAIAPDTPAPSSSDVGARIEMDAATSLALSDSPLEIELDLDPFSTLGVESVAVSVQSDGEVQWVTAAVPDERGKVVVQAPASPIVTAIGIRPVTTQKDGPRGFILYAVTVRKRP
jgi:hypothetical protein